LTWFYWLCGLLVIWRLIKKACLCLYLRIY